MSTSNQSSSLNSSFSSSFDFNTHSSVNSSFRIQNNKEITKMENSIWICEIIEHCIETLFKHNEGQTNPKQINLSSFIAANNSWFEVCSSLFASSFFSELFSQFPLLCSYIWRMNSTLTVKQQVDQHAMRT